MCINRIVPNELVLYVKVKGSQLSLAYRLHVRISAWVQVRASVSSLPEGGDINALGTDGFIPEPG